MNKAELIEALAAQFDGSKAQAAKALSAVTDTIMYTTARGEKVSITGFGVFESVRRPARMVRNPRTGERKRAKASSVPKFRAGSELKAFVNGDKKPPRVTAKKAVATPAAKTTATKTAATKTAAKKSPAKRTSPAKTTTPAKKAPAKKATAKTTTAKKAVAKKASATKTAAKKAPAKRTAKKA